MTDVEIGYLTLLAKGIFVFISALCIAVVLKDVMAGKGWRSVRPVLVWLTWGLVSWLGAFLVFVLANAHTYVSGKLLMIRVIVLVYLLLGIALSVYLVRHLRHGPPPDAG